MGFIETIAPMIQSKCAALGYKYPSAIIAQACIESNYGKSLLSINYHNYFGLKAGSKWHGKSVNLVTKEVYSNRPVSIKDNFRVYANMAAGVSGYFDFINAQRYHDLKAASSNQDYLLRIKKDGYCTAPNYVMSCMNVIKKYNLDKYDSISTMKGCDIKMDVLKNGSKGSQVKSLQSILKGKFSYTIDIDGSFGPKTNTTLRNFQMLHQLKVDGLCGPATWEKLLK